MKRRAYPKTDRPKISDVSRMLSRARRLLREFAREPPEHSDDEDLTECRAWMVKAQQIVTQSRGDPDDAKAKACALGVELGIHALKVALEKIGELVG